MFYHIIGMYSSHGWNSNLPSLACPKRYPVYCQVSIQLSDERGALRSYWRVDRGYVEVGKEGYIGLHLG